MADASDTDYSSGLPNTHVDNKANAQEGVIIRADPLSLEIEDEELVKIIDKRINDERKFYKSKYDLYERRKKNEMYLFGRQITEVEKAGKLKDYESKNLDNVLYEIESTIRPLAMSQLPDLLITPGNDSDDSRNTAQKLSKAIDTDIKKYDNRKVLAQAFIHRPVYLVGVIKVIWNPELEGGQGDYEFQAINPDNIDFDHTVPSAKVDDMQWIAQRVPITVEQCIMRFPKKKDEFFAELKRQGVTKGEQPNWREMATEIAIREVWFTWYKKKEDNKWERVEGVCWKFVDTILGKMKNPNFDYEGDERLFTYDQPGVQSTKRQITPQEMQQTMMGALMGQPNFPPNVTKETIYQNYFKMPRKPFFLMTYDQWGKQPMDETSHLEQNIKNQQILDQRQKNIEEKLNTRGHHVWSKESGFQQKDIEKMDHNNPDEDYLADGDVNRTHKFIEPEEPSQQEFADLDRVHTRMYAISGSTAVRGQMQTDVATTNQIAREANYTRADDLVDSTINPAASWMAEQAMQFIKLRYTQEHFRWLLGSQGELIYAKLHQNLIEEGMIVKIKASGTDKIKKQNNAMEMAKMQLTDPLSFFEDMGLDDPEGRTMKLLTFTSDPKLYLLEFVAKSAEVTPDLIAKLQQMVMPPPPMAGAQQGAPAPQGPQTPTPSNTAAAPMAPQPGVQASPNGVV